jgi:hypothetical protein
MKPHIVPLLVCLLGFAQVASPAPANWRIDATMNQVYCGFPLGCNPPVTYPASGTFTLDPATFQVTNANITYKGATWTYGRMLNSRLHQCAAALSLPHAGVHGCHRSVRIRVLYQQQRQASVP